MKQAILLVNMGGPANLEGVQPYLRSIFRDPAILPLPRFLREPLAWSIATLRTKKVAERYEKIGGKSPLLHWTRRLTAETAKALKETGSGISVTRAFRYCEPTIESALQSLKEEGVGIIHLIPLFPHYTKAMTGSIITEADLVSEELGITIRPVRSWWNHLEILPLYAEYLQEALQKAGEPVTVLFVAHGIPQKAVEKGEDYPEQVWNHARELANSLPARVPWALAFQSRVGPVKWTGPYLEAEIDRLATVGGTLVLMPLSFVADCLETLYDLDIVATEQARRAGFQNVIRVRVFNDDPRFARALIKLLPESSHVQ